MNALEWVMFVTGAFWWAIIAACTVLGLTAGTCRYWRTHRPPAPGTPSPPGVSSHHPPFPRTGRLRSWCRAPTARYRAHRHHRKHPTDWDGEFQAELRRWQT